MGNLVQVLVILISLNFNISDSIRTIDTAMIESERINDIDFTFEKDGNNFKFEGKFEIENNIECLKTHSFEFNHRKKFTTNVDEIHLAEKGEDWYEAYFIVRKYFMAEVIARYRYELINEKDEIHFDLISTQINIPGLDVVKSGNGIIRFKEIDGKTFIHYTLKYSIRKSIFKNRLFKIQKKETVSFLSDYKKYISTNCTN